ncbi:hypothetical protein NMY22_g2514 [Coprinellus aureogranulatus]|nr:hypothetical protein NMY22_g2514 [Coprinellus aureogranulatus]
MATETMNALVTAPGNTAGVAEVPVPQAAPNEIRIKVHSIALNPVDALYAITQQVGAPGRVIGSDVAGCIDQIGEAVPEGKWKLGDRVAGLLQGATSANPRQAASLHTPSSRPISPSGFLTTYRSTKRPLSLYAV